MLHAGKMAFPELSKAGIADGVAGSGFLMRSLRRVWRLQSRYAKQVADSPSTHRHPSELFRAVCRRGALRRDRTRAAGRRLKHSEQIPTGRQIMKFQPTKFEGATLIEIEPAADARGSFARTFCSEDFAHQGLETTFVQHSISSSRLRGTVRGMHFQRAPHAEVKVVRCLKGALADVIVDLRPQSATFLSWQMFELSAENGRQLYIPKGFAHGFQTLTADCDVSYLISDFYTPSAASGVRWDDPRVNIAWPLPVSCISDKDRSWPDVAL